MSEAVSWAGRHDDDRKGPLEAVAPAMDRSWEPRDRGLVLSLMSLLILSLLSLLSMMVVVLWSPAGRIDDAPERL